MAEPYLFPVSILKDIEPWLTEYFAYQRFHIQPEIEQYFGVQPSAPYLAGILVA